MNSNVLIEIEKYIENNDIESAFTLILSNEREYEKNSHFWNLKGVLCFNVGESETAISCFTRALELEPDYQAAIENLTFVRSQCLDDLNEDLYTLTDEKFVIGTVDILDTAILKVESCIKGFNEGDFSTFMLIFKDVQSSMELYNKDISRLKKIVPSRFMPNLFENILVCIKDCFQHYSLNRCKELKLLTQFTLHSLLKELREEIYFFGVIYPDTNKIDKYYKNEFAVANANQYARESLRTGEYKYPVSIIVPAYNKLEYTKQCVESILKYTNEIDYELILVNDGSSDGTKEYFESIPYENKKVISFHKNTGAMLAYLIGVRSAQGKVLASVSNDVVVTKNWLKNLLTCLESDTNIGLVVPIANNMSNGQAISVKYDTMEQMQDFAKVYNKSNPNKWFERERLCPFVHVVPMSIYGNGICLDRLFQYAEFSDDDISLQLRLNGYKLILACDTLCHHFGSVSLGEAQRENDSIQISRKIYEQKNKVDAWNDVVNKTGHLLTNIIYKNNKVINVLCIDPGFGMIPYGLRNIYKEKGNSNIKLYNFSTDKRFIDISNKIFDHFVSAKNNLELVELLNGMTFEYILFCKPFEEYADEELLELLFKNMKKLLSDNGEIRFLVSNPYSASTIINLISINNIFGDHVFKRFASQVAIEKALLDAGYSDVKRIGIKPEKSNQLAVDDVKKMALSINVKANSLHDNLYSSDLLLFIIKP